MEFFEVGRIISQTCSPRIPEYFHHIRMHIDSLEFTQINHPGIENAVVLARPVKLNEDLGVSLLLFRVQTLDVEETETELGVQFELLQTTTVTQEGLERIHIILQSLFIGMEDS